MSFEYTKRNLDLERIMREEMVRLAQEEDQKQREEMWRALGIKPKPERP